MIILIKIIFKKTHKIKKNLNMYFPCDSYFSLLYRYFIDNQGSTTIIEIHVTEIPQLSITHNTCF